MKEVKEIVEMLSDEQILNARRAFSEMPVIFQSMVPGFGLVVEAYAKVQDERHWAKIHDEVEAMKASINAKRAVE